ncbi:AMP-binding protein [Limnofasciculus baicalensis]|nr:AMP-binding protein [Limnofasciculus baicalensis]
MALTTSGLGNTENLDYSSGNEHQINTLVDLLQIRARHQPHKQGFIFLKDGETPSLELTYQELDTQARAIAARLQSQGATGERALLLYPSGLDFIAAFFGCLYAGVVAVPAYPPRPNQKISRIEAIVEDSMAKFALTTTSLLDSIERKFAENPTATPLQWLTTDNIDSDTAANWQTPNCDRNTLAFLQYTSGSTGTPKGVMISHGNLIYNSALINRCFEDTSNSHGVSWLPPYHDMGLIGGVLQPLYVGATMMLMSPVDFLQKPFRWLEAISRYQVTTSGGPDFAYNLCLRKIKPEQLHSLDLSSWKLAFTGAEPVRTKTLTEFAEMFAPCGFRLESFYPCYGMAETTLIVTGGLKSAPPVICDVQSAALAENKVIAANGLGDSRSLVGCGSTRLEEKIAIANPDSFTHCTAHQVGEIWVSGPSVAQGYWHREDLTKEIFNAYFSDTKEGPFLRTGDLGFFQEGELFITGRLKDLIIIRGRNHYPQDIELTVEHSHPALRPGNGAAFSVEVDNAERLVIVQEVERTHLRKLNVDEVIEAIRRNVSTHHELQIDAVILIKTGTIPKTSSGKIQRHACKTGFIENSLTVVGEWKSGIEWVGASFEDKLSVDSKTNMVNQPLESSLPKQQTPTTNTNNQQQKTNDIIQWLRSYASDRINSRIIDERRTIPPYIVLDFGNQGLLGMQVPQSYGGLGLNNVDTLRIMEQLGAIDPTISLFVGLSNVLGIRPILNYATQTVKDELLPILARGRELGAFALTEPGAGSNPQAISSRALPDNRGGWRISGTKIWSGSAAWAGVINVFVQNIDAQGKANGISGFVVRQGTKGLRQGPEALTMGMRGMIQNTVYFEDVQVSPENLLGEAGKGMNAAQDAMMYGRLAIAASSIGGMKRCAQLMLRYATARTISTGRLLDNPTTLTRVSNLTAAITATETLISQVARFLDEGIVVPVDAYVVCKIAGPEFLWQAADQLVQLLGGRGYIETNIAPQILRDARILRIFEGPTETLTMFLGSRVINSSTELEQFLGERLGAKQIAERLKAAAEEISQRSRGDSATFSDNTTAIRWSYSLTGEVALYAVLWAGVQAQIKQNPSPQLHRALEWTKLNFEQTLAKALTGTPAESVVMTPNQTTDLVSSYIETIGDLEQTLAGEDHELDSLLKRGIVTGETPILSITNNPSAAQSPTKSAITNNPSAAKSAAQSSPKSATPSVTSVTPSAATTQSIKNWMVEWLVKELKLPAKSIDTSKSFADYGLDSVTAVELSDALQDWLGITLSPTLAYDYPTIESMAQYLSGESGKETEEVRVEKGEVNDFSVDLASEEITKDSSGDEEVDLLLAELEGLSAEEAEALLGKQI